MMRIVIVQKALSLTLKVLDATKAAAGQKTTLQCAKEPFGLIEPRAMLRGEMKDMSMAGVTPPPALRTERTPRCGGR